MDAHWFIRWHVHSCIGSYSYQYLESWFVFPLAQNIDVAITYSVILRIYAAFLGPKTAEMFYIPEYQRIRLTSAV